MLVTGGGSGIGAATVERLVKEGYKVAFMDNNKTNGQAISSKTGAFFVEGSIGSVADIERCVKEAVAHLGNLQGLFANAGIYKGSTLLEMTEEDFDNIININLKGCVWTVKSCLPHLIANGSGSIVLMSSDQTYVGKTRSAAYGMSKAAIGSLTRTTAVDYGEHKIRCNAVCPATIRTALSEGAMTGWATKASIDETKMWEEEAKAHLVGRVGTPEEVANLVHFLLSSESSFMTGGLYLIDGGFTCK